MISLSNRKIQEKLAEVSTNIEQFKQSAKYLLGLDVNITEYLPTVHDGQSLSAVSVQSIVSESPLDIEFLQQIESLDARQSSSLLELELLQKKLFAYHATKINPAELSKIEETRSIRLKEIKEKLDHDSRVFIFRNFKLYVLQISIESFAQTRSNDPYIISDSLNSAAAILAINENRNSTVLLFQFLLFIILLGRGNY